MLVLGIDPGFTGGLAIIDSKTLEVVEKCPMPMIEVKKQKSRKVRKTDPEYGKQKTKTYTGTHKMVNLHKLNAKLERMSEQVGVAYLEQVHARPAEGVSSSFRFGQGYGNLEAFLIAHGIKTVYVTPQAWTKKIHKGVTSSIDAKGKSVIIVNRLYPKEEIILEGCKKPHEGLVDAILIARYGAEEENASE